MPFILSTNAGLNKLLTLTLKVPKFVGVFACDLMPTLKVGQSVILNTDRHTLSGTHFICIIRVKRHFFEYFDSLNVDLPTAFPQLHEELTRRGIYRHLKPALSTPVQHHKSQMCGLFCVDYILKKTFVEYSAISTKLHTDTGKLWMNDTRVITNIDRWLDHLPELLSS